MNIQQESADPSNYGGSIGTIDTIVIHGTGGGSIQGSIDWFKTKRSSPSSAHYIVGRDGELVNTVPEENIAYHAGVSSLYDRNNVNKFSIGIEVDNWLQLKYVNGMYKSWTGKTVDINSVYTERYNNEDSFWEYYLEDQISSLVELINDVSSRYSIKYIIGHRNIAFGRKIDPGLAFPWDSIPQGSIEVDRGFESNLK